LFTSGTLEQVGGTCPIGQETHEYCQKNNEKPAKIHSQKKIGTRRRDFVLK
jgi:hypothetical protein